MKIFITGASGYLGGELVKSLSRQHDVTALIRSTSSQLRIKECDCDVLFVDNASSLEKGFCEKTPDILINTAASYGRAGEALDVIVESNLSFPCRILALARKYAVKVFLNTGTSLPENVNTYALTKNVFVTLAVSSNSFSTKFVNLALEHFFGAGDDRNKFTSHVISSCISGQSLDLTDGSQRRDFIYIRDVLRVFDALLESLDSLVNNETVSVGSGVAPTVREFVEMALRVSSSTSTLHFGVVEPRVNEPMYSCADLSRLNELGWSPQFGLESGIRDMIKGEG